MCSRVLLLAFMYSYMLPCTTMCFHAPPFVSVYSHVLSYTPMCSHIILCTHTYSHVPCDVGHLSRSEPAKHRRANPDGSRRLRCYPPHAPTECLGTMSLLCHLSPSAKGHSGVYMPLWYIRLLTHADTRYPPLRTPGPVAASDGTVGSWSTTDHAKERWRWCLSDKAERLQKEEEEDIQDPNLIITNLT